MEIIQSAPCELVGKFLIFDFTGKPRSTFENLPVGEHGMEQVSFGQKTEAHKHDFPSFYKSEGLDLLSEGERISLPQRAVTLVMIGADHSWVPKQTKGAVGSMDSQHRKQVTVAA
jgi:hypothetical protein